jgi:SAM-dependent methyltransferase
MHQKRRRDVVEALRMNTHDPIDQVSPWVRRWAPLIPRGATVLDLACGSGRHTRFLAARGARVLAVDRDAQTLSVLQAEYGVETLAADLEQASWPLASRRFDAVVVTNYLFRPAWSRVLEMLAPQGGLLIYETFMEGNANYGRPSNADFLLRPGELLRLTEGMRVIAFEQGILDGRAVIQRICARKDEAPQPLY